MSISLGTKSVPDPQPYDPKEERRQQESFYFVLNQILKDAQQQNMTLSELISQGLTVPSTITFDSPVFEEIRDNIKDLQFTGIVVDLGPFKFAWNGRAGLTITES